MGREGRLREAVRAAGGRRHCGLTPTLHARRCLWRPSWYSGRGVRGGVNRRPPQPLVVRGIHQSPPGWCALAAFRRRDQHTRISRPVASRGPADAPREVTPRHTASRMLVDNDFPADSTRAVAAVDVVIDARRSLGPASERADGAAESPVLTPSGEHARQPAPGGSPCQCAANPGAGDVVQRHPALGDGPALRQRRARGGSRRRGADRHNGAQGDHDNRNGTSHRRQPNPLVLPGQRSHHVERRNGQSGVTGLSSGAASDTGGAVHGRGCYSQTGVWVSLQRNLSTVELSSRMPISRTCPLMQLGRACQRQFHRW
jgi:hypothetical protein